MDVTARRLGCAVGTSVTVPESSVGGVTLGEAEGDGVGELLLGIALEGDGVGTKVGAGVSTEYCTVDTKGKVDCRDGKHVPCERIRFTH